MFNKCKPINKEKTDALFKDYCAEKGILYENTKFIASGSVGAVYYVNHEGDEMVFKVRYADIEKIWESDIAFIKKSVKLTSMLNKGSHVDIDELNEVMKNDMDYENELKNHVIMYDIWHGNESIIIPKPYIELSTSNVICSEFLDFVPLNEHIANIGQIEKNKIINKLMNFCISSMFNHKIIYGDLHWGNVFIKGDKVAIIDYGMITIMPDKDALFTLEMCRAIKNNDKEAVLKKSESMYGISGENGELVYSCYELFVRSMIGEFTYTKQYIDEIEKNITIHEKLPDNTFLMMRSSLMLSNIATYMNATIDMSEVFNGLIEQKKLEE